MRKSALLSSLAAVVSSLLTGCPFIHYGYDHPTGQFPNTPVNLSEINTEYNDFNLSTPETFSERHFHFSSDRNSAGANFDIVGKHFTYEWNKSDGTFDLYLSESNESVLIGDVLERINTTSNEFGPYSLFHWPNLDNLSYLMIFARQTEHGLDNFVITADKSSDGTWSIDSTVECTAINSAADDGYVALVGQDPSSNFSDYYNNSLAAMKSVFFCSSRNGPFDIYEAAINRGDELISLLTQVAGLTVTRNAVLSSTSDDKCPSITGNAMVFTSNRPGGLGGFDLYYSLNRNGSWSEPVNFGSNVNSEFDEYRPVLVSDNEFDNDVLFFSSNRPGGKGGYDLYYCGVPTLVENGY